MSIPTDPLLKCFANIEILLDKEGLSLTNPDLRADKLEERMIRRWRDLSPPRPREGTTMMIGRAIWRQMHAAKDPAVKSSVLRELRLLARNSNPTWQSADELGLWFVERSHASATGTEACTPPPSAVPEASQPSPENPFFARRAIEHGEFFFGRQHELRRIRTYLCNGQSLQIVGPRRIGKTSLLHKIRHSATEWLGPEVRTAFIDMQGVTSQALWFELAAIRFGFPQMLPTIQNFAKAVREACEQGCRLVVCLDEFEGVTEHPAEFSEDFFDALRSLAQEVMYTGRFSLVASARVPISELCVRSPAMSAMPNILSLVDAKPFRPEEAERFVRASRSGIPPFTTAEMNMILERAKAHPLKLNIVCYHVLEARITGDDLAIALKGSDAEIEALMGAGE